MSESDVTTDSKSFCTYNLYTYNKLIHVSKLLCNYNIQVHNLNYSHGLH